MKELKRSYEILDELRLENGLYKASVSNTYNFVWLRDCFYEVLPYLDKDCGRYEKTYHSLLDIFKKYEWKIDYHIKNKPVYVHEYIHARFDVENFEEINQEWGNAQNDSIGAILWGIAKGLEYGKKIWRDESDKRITEKLVKYLESCQYWKDRDNGVWEEWLEVHMSSVGACVSGLYEISKYVDVNRDIIYKGYETLYQMFPIESNSRQVDLIQMSLIYPFGIMIQDDARLIIERVEKTLLKTNGVSRYRGDSYYSTLEKEFGRNCHPSKYYGTEAEWTFGLAWLGLCYLELGNVEKAEMYKKWTEMTMLKDCSLPELYMANTDEYNENTPLGWSQAMYILLSEKLFKINLK